MPGKSPGPSIKNPAVYEALRKKGMSKEKAARISNAMGDRLVRDRELPLEVKMMPAKARAVWRAAFRSSIKEEPERLAGMLALRAVQKEFSRTENEEGEEEWIEKSEAEKKELEGLAEEVGRMAEVAGNLGGGEGENGNGNGEDEGEVEPGRRGPSPEDDPDDDDDEPEYSKTTKTTETTETRRARRRREAEAEAEGEAEGEGEGASAGDSFQFDETFTLDADTAKRFGMRLRKDGYLVAEPRVARTGVQLYRGHELGRPDMEVVRVMRPESEVFDKRAMSSLAHVPITLDHPDTPVDSTNWKKLAVGHSTGDVARDGDYVRVPLMIADKAAIDAAQSGTSQLSVGYSARLLWGEGENGAGEKFDAMQTQIRANHIAMVSAARGGEKLKLGDHNRSKRTPGKGKNMTTRNIDGVTIELEDRDDQILGRHLSALNKQIADQGADVEKIKAQIAALQAQLAAAMKAGDAKDGEIGALKQKVEDSKITPEIMDKALNLRMDVVDRATAFFGDAQKYAWNGKADTQIRRDVVAARLGDQKTKLMNDDAVEGAFLSITETEQQDGFQRMTQSFSRPPSPSFNDKAAAAYDKRNADLSNRWKVAKMRAGGATA